MAIDNWKGEIVFQLLIGQVTVYVISHSWQLKGKMKGAKDIGLECTSCCSVESGRCRLRSGHLSVAAIA